MSGLRGNIFVRFVGMENQAFQTEWLEVARREELGVQGLTFELKGRMLLAAASFRKLSFLMIAYMRHLILKVTGKKSASCGNSVRLIKTL